MASRLDSLTADAVHAALAEYQRLGREAFLKRYGFGEARRYLVRDPLTGALCDSKAIAGAAIGYLPGATAPLNAKDFSGGAATVQRVLEQLGFELAVDLAEPDEAAQPLRGTVWSPDELQLVVRDYLDMLMLELAGQPYNKSERRRRLVPLLNDRSEASIEFKRRNISAVLEGLGVPALRGYLRADNIQRDLGAEVERQLRLRTELDDAARNAAERPCQIPDDLSFSRLMTDAPERSHHVREAEPAYMRSPIRRDYFEREASNRKTGRAGEELVVQFERWRLADRGLGQLADRVEHVAVTRGDGLGYDVLSYEVDGTEKHVEVKTTTFSQTTPFFVSSNEAAFARANRRSFALYRVFDFRASPRIFELRGEIERHCHLDPITYRATFQ